MADSIRNQILQGDDGLDPSFKSYDQLHHEVETLKQQVATDALMEISSRNEVLNLITEISDKNLPATMYFIDVDHFKDINDSLGHDGGDEVFRILGKRFKDHIKEGDMVGRFGGDEMIAILRGDAPDEIYFQRAEEIRLAIAKDPIEYDNGSVNVTVSIGVAKRNKYEKAKDWLKRADKASYEAKLNGRNQVVVGQSV